MGIFDIFTGKGYEAAARAKAAGYGAGKDEAYKWLDEGLKGSKEYYDKAYVPFSELYSKATGGVDAYYDATGASGSEGLSRAKSLFTATPGYTEGLDRTLDQNDRRAAARGMLASGNTIADTAKLTTDYANEKYGDYVSRLAPSLSAAQGAAAGGAGVLTGYGDKVLGTGAAKANYGYNANVGIGNANAEGEMAGTYGGANIWNALMGGGNMLAKLWGMK